MTLPIFPTKSHNASAPDAKKNKIDPSYAMIATKAYEIWLAEGQQAGCEQKNWFAAEVQLQRA